MVTSSPSSLSAVLHCGALLEDNMKKGQYLLAD